jgi:hypothetical protein
MSVDPRRLIAAHRLVEDALRGDQALAQEGEAVLGLVEAGRELASVLKGVANDESFWDWLTSESAGLARPLSDNEEALFQALTGGELAGILVILGYQPPPPVQEFVDDTVDALGSALALDLSAYARRTQVLEARWALYRFRVKLHELLDQSGLSTPAHRSRLRSLLRKGARVALAIAPPLALFGVSTGVGAALAIPTGLVGAATSPVAGPLADRLRELLPDEQGAAAKSADLVMEVLPTRRVLALSAVVGGRLASIERAGSATRTATDDLYAATTRYKRAAVNHLVLSEECYERFHNLLAGIDSLADASDLAEQTSALGREWRALDHALQTAETQAEHAKRLRREETERLRREEEEREEAAARDAVARQQQQSL